MTTKHLATKLSRQINRIIESELHCNLFSFLFMSLKYWNDENFKDICLKGMFPSLKRNLSELTFSNVDSTVYHTCNGSPAVKICFSANNLLSVA